MTMKRLAVEFGMGTDLRGADYTKAGMDGLIAKPINVTALFEAIEQALAQPAKGERTAA